MAILCIASDKYWEKNQLRHELIEKSNIFQCVYLPTYTYLPTYYYTFNRLFS